MGVVDTAEKKSMVLPLQSSLLSGDEWELASTFSEVEAPVQSLWLCNEAGEEPGTRGGRASHTNKNSKHTC